MRAAPIQRIEAALWRASSCNERAAADAALMHRLRALRIWQAQRLAGTYRDLHADPGYRQALDFFLSDLYGPDEFVARDQAFARAWPLLRRVMTAALLEVLVSALEVHALTLEFDVAMARALPAGELSAVSYLAAYRAVDNAPRRAEQINLIVSIGEQLAVLMHRPWVRLALRAAHAPAHAAGLGALQGFLERGYATFHTLSNARALLDTIRTRETRLMVMLLAADEAPALELLSRHNGAANG